MYQPLAQPPTSVSELGSAVQHDLEIAQAANTSLDMNLEAQYEALEDMPAQHPHNGGQHHLRKH